MFLPTQKNDPGLYPYRQGLYFAFFNAMNWQVATATPTVLFMAYLGADSLQTGLVYSWPLLLTPIQVFATMLLPKMGFKKLTLAGWGARSWFLLVPFTLAVFSRHGTEAWMISAMVVAMFFYSLSRSIGAAAITTWLQGLVPEKIRGRYWANDQIMGGVASVGTLVLCAAAFAWLPLSWAFMGLYVFSIIGAWLAYRCLQALPDIERPTVMSFAKIRVDTPRHLFGRGDFRRYLWLTVLYYFIITPLVPFGAYYLKLEAGFSSASIMGFTVLQYAGVIGGNWFMRSRIDQVGAKPFLRLAFTMFALIAVGWLVCLHWTLVIIWLIPLLFILLGCASGVFIAANVSYLAKILPEQERALPISLHGALTLFTGGLSPVVWGLMLKDDNSLSSLNPVAFQGFFIFTLIGSIALVLLVNRLEEKSGQVDPILEGSWLFRPFRVVSNLIKLAEPKRPGEKPETKSS